MKQVLKIIFIFFMVTFLSCEKDAYNESTTVDIPNPEIIVQNTSLVVYVEDNWGTQPRAFVSVNGQNVETDEKGRAFIKLNKVSMKGDLVSIEADNRIPLNKRVLIQPGKKNILHVYLEKFNKRIGLNSEEEVSFSAGSASVTIPPNAMEYKDGSGPYSGNFSAWYQYLGPMEEDIPKKMPGDLLALNSEEELMRLQNYGMVKVEFLATDGKLLDIKEGLKVKINITIPTELEDDAPETIPTFWMNENTGLWIEEGTAIKVPVGIIGITGYVYSFEVEHFTWWACHLYSCAREIVTIRGTLVLEDGSACSGCKLEIIGTDISTTVTTNSDGTFGVLSCPDEMYELIGYYQGINCESNDGQSLGFYSSGSQDTDWGEIIIDDADIISISGTIYDCEGNTEEGSYLMINESIIIETTENGQFEFLACYHPDSILLLEGFNEAGTLMSDALHLQLESQGNVGLELFSCLESDVYLDVYRDGTLVQHVGRIAQDRICNEGNKICIAVGKEYFDDEYFSAVLEFIDMVDLNQIVTYTDLEVTPQSSILYAEDVHNNINFWIGILETIDILEVQEYGTHKKVYLKFQALAGPDTLELNYEIEFRIRI